MKRALAERAKQSLPNVSSDDVVAPAPPTKLQRVATAPKASPSPPGVDLSSSASSSSRSERNTGSSAGTAVTTGNSRSGQKRQRPEIAVSSEASAFYLQHQNRALGIEWQSLNLKVKQLEAERDQRRQDCWTASQALHSLQATWTQLETVLTGQAHTHTFQGENSIQQKEPSTGVGDSVEWTRALSDALANLGGTTNSGSERDDDGLPQGNRADWSQCAANLAARAQVLQEHLWPVVKTADAAVVDAATLQKSLQECIGEKQLLQNQVTELQQARDACVASERRVRRNVYRLATGMITAEQIVKAVESDEDAPVKREVNNEARTMKPIKQEFDSEEIKVKTNLSSSEVESLQGRVSDMEQAVSNREKAVQELTEKLKEKEERITQLTARQRSDEDTRKLADADATTKKLEAAEAKAKALAEKMEELNKKWAQALGNEKALKEAASEQQSKFCKRWAELNSLVFADETEQKNGTEPSAVRSQQEQMAAKNVELTHKLDQALENVRQAESTRQDLKDALSLNKSLQARLDEAKSKSSSKSDAHNGSSHQESSRSSGREWREPAANLSVEKIEKLQREHRRTRKELAAATASKENAKAKLERAEKDRESLQETNSRLIAQTTEKDEMNAKSLSTILHLKSLTEKLTAERDNLEMQVKSASQLALAARLATNAKERVSDEMSKEKQALEEKLKNLEDKIDVTTEELRGRTTQWSEASGKMATLNTELKNALSRSDELVAELEKKNEEILRLSDDVAKAEREARDASEKFQTLTKNSGGDVSAAASTFTVDQLNTQIAVLKNRLACPVCHYRDKECIIMRCRHMHCKQCVEERISNRSRKCPTCNNKFSDKDVEDIWLN